MRISDWSSDVCSSDLHDQGAQGAWHTRHARDTRGKNNQHQRNNGQQSGRPVELRQHLQQLPELFMKVRALNRTQAEKVLRSEEHTSELQSLMRIPYAVFCLKKKKPNNREYDTVTYNE